MNAASASQLSCLSHYIGPKYKMWSVIWFWMWKGGKSLKNPSRLNTKHDDWGNGRKIYEHGKEQVNHVNTG